MNSSNIHLGAYLGKPSQDHRVPCYHYLTFCLCSKWKIWRYAINPLTVKEKPQKQGCICRQSITFLELGKWCWVWNSLLPRIPEKIKTVHWLDFLLSCLSAEHAVCRHKTKFNEFNCNITVKYMSKEVFESIYTLSLSSKSLCLGPPKTISLGVWWSSTLLWVSLDL